MRVITTPHPSPARDAGRYGKYEPTNEMWYPEFEKWLEESAFPDGSVKFERDIVPQLRALTMVSLEAARPFLEQPEDVGYSSFHLFGYDFMIDAAGKVWLIEINSSPAAAAAIQPRLVEDLIDVAIEPTMPSVSGCRGTGAGAAPAEVPVAGGAGGRAGGSSRPAPPTPLGVDDPDESEEEEDIRLRLPRASYNRDRETPAGLRQPRARRAHSEPRAPLSPASRRPRDAAGAAGGSVGAKDAESKGKRAEDVSAAAVGTDDDSGEGSDGRAGLPYSHSWGFERIDNMKLDLSRYAFARDR